MIYISNGFLFSSKSNPLSYSQLCSRSHAAASPFSLTPSPVRSSPTTFLISSSLVTASDSYRPSLGTQLPYLPQSRQVISKFSLSLLSFKYNRPVSFLSLQQTTSCGLSSLSPQIPRGLSKSWWYTSLSSVPWTSSAPLLIYLHLQMLAPNTKKHIIT